MLKVLEVKTKKQLKRFIDFPYELYAGNPYWIPPLRADEISTLRWDKNPAFAYCQARYWLVYKDNQLAGRIAGIINHEAIEKWGQKYARFGWFDFIDDLGVMKLLLQQVESWAQENGLSGIQGPMGFCDLDKEGMLIDGFDEMGTFTTIYNYDYYPKFMEMLGYTKDVDWYEYIMEVPDKLGDDIIKIAEVVKDKNKLRTITFTKSKQILPYAKAIFDLINQTYRDLYNVVPLSDEQVEFFTKQYFSVVNPDYINIVLDENDRLAAFSIGFPSLAETLQKTKGKLLPLGFIRILRALKVNNSVDMLLIAVRPDLQGKGVNSLLMKAMTEACWKNGVKVAHLNPQLEDNRRVRSQWKRFTGQQNKKRRCYYKDFEEQYQNIDQKTVGR
ncbi:MAG: GNAT family N-acetyltransferase [Clostridia bacterium]|nr:GNAT family N-acetyltransferase [Clostridia bacterium]MDD4679804.1 GNAT family N-acetyltransferase [Clostridia bacterium]